MTLVDTTVWIDLFADRHTPQVSLFESLIAKREDICLCGVILTEVLQGIKDEKEYSKTRSILLNLIYLPMEFNTFLLAADIYRSTRSKGITIRNSVDCMIAAVCIENDVPILHNDKDFDLIAKEFDMGVLMI
ncbi:MAG: type II toxin-antitoxin system VapC family toxin [Thermodesulfobacteriota bacterium]